MTPQEAKTKFKAIITEEINRFPSHYGAEIDDNVYSDTSRVNEILELNKVVCEALEKQMPKIPDYEGDGYADGFLVYDTWICPNCGKYYDVDFDDYEYCPLCGQAIDWSALE